MPVLIAHCTVAVANLPTSERPQYRPKAEKTLSLEVTQKIKNPLLIFLLFRKPLSTSERPQHTTKAEKKH